MTYYFCTRCARHTYHVKTGGAEAHMVCAICSAPFQQGAPMASHLTCLLCGKEGEIVVSIPMATKKLVKLSCGHTCTFALSTTESFTQKEPVMSRKHTYVGEQHTCHLCKGVFWTALTNALGDFCFSCKQEWKIDNLTDAEEITLMMATGVILDPPGGKEEKVVHGSFSSQRALSMAKVKVDDVAVAEGIRQMVDYRTLPIDQFEKAITYVTAKNGLFEVRHSDLCTIVTRPKEVLGMTQDMKEGMTLNLPKLPFDFLIQTISFFRGVCTKQQGSSEAMVQIWWDREDKVYLINVPDQRVGGASVHHTSTFDRENSGRYYHVMDIHSHGASMSAFWSGTDDADEKKITSARLFGVIGKVQQPIPEWKFRLSNAGTFTDLSMVEVFEVPSTSFNFSVSSDILFRQLDVKDAVKDGRVLLTCPVDPFVSVEIPEEWYTHVQGHSHRGHGGYRGEYGGHSGHSGPAPWHNQHMKGFLFVSGEEYEYEDGTLKKTGHKLITKKEQEDGQHN